MKFAMVRTDGSVTPALVLEDQLVLLGTLATDLVALIEGGPDAIEGARTLAARRDTPRLVLAESVLASPVTRFRRDVLCTGWNYYEHFKEGEELRGQVERPTAPTFFTKSPETVVGPSDPIQIDSTIGIAWDYEAEVALVIGRAGRSIPQENASEHVFGYMLANDVSQRELQRRHGGQWSKGKSLDKTMPLGPFLVTADDLHLDELSFELRLNGALMQEGLCRDMAFAVPELLVELSLGMTLRPGDILLTGTPAGVGQSRKPPVYLADGDSIEIACPQLGRQQNSVIDVHSSPVSPPD